MEGLALRAGRCSWPASRLRVCVWYPPMKSNRVPVQIDAETYRLLKAYSEQTGVPVARVVSGALKDWLNTVGVARLAVLGTSRRLP